MRILVSITNGKGVRLTKAVDSIPFANDNELLQDVAEHYKVNPSLYYIAIKEKIRGIINDTHTGICKE